MSEVQSRPSAPRGRSSARGGRSGFGSRGGRGGRSHTTNGDKVENAPPATIEDDGEVGQLKKLYGSKVGTIKEMFPDWTDEDAVFALQETDGDLETTVERITDGEALFTDVSASSVCLLYSSKFGACNHTNLVHRVNHPMGRGVKRQEGSISIKSQGEYHYDPRRKYYWSKDVTGWPCCS
jgi:hypothetical protein